MKDPLVIKGWLQHMGGWRLPDMLRNAGMDPVERECEQNMDDGIPPPKCQKVDLQKATIIFCYSFGVSSAWDESGGWHDPQVQDVILVVDVAGVTDWTKGQFHFSAPACAERAYCIYASQAIPATNPFPDCPTFQISDPNIRQRLQENKRANICVDALYDPQPFIADIEKRVAIHTTIQNKPEVLDLCMWMVETLA